MLTSQFGLFLLLFNLTSIETAAGRDTVPFACRTGEVRCPDGTCVPRPTSRCTHDKRRGDCDPPTDYDDDALCNGNSTNRSSLADAHGDQPTDYDNEESDDGACDAVGSVTSVPSPLSGLCHCKAQVRGERCSHCAPRAFFLNAAAPDGCIPCWCSGLTTDCGPGTDSFRDAIMLDHSTAHTSLTLTNAARTVLIDSDIQIDLLNRQVIYRHFRLQPDYIYYWSLPREFTGNKVTSYGGNLYLTVKFEFSEPPNTEPLVILIGANGGQVVFEHDLAASPFANGVTQSVSIPIYEQHWRDKTSGRLATRASLMSILAKVEAMLIKATPSWDTFESSLLDVTLDTAVSSKMMPDMPTYVTRAASVELCRCPAGYDGTSCETCAAGYTRSQAGHYLGGVCVPCYCNGHSSDCDPHSGICHNCGHNTSGDFCGECVAGFVGDPSRGTPGDCRPIPYGVLLCNCGLGRCRMTETGESECVCPFGRTGPRCEVDMGIEEPSFIGTSWAAYPKLVGVLMSTQIRIKFKTYDLERDQLIVYAAQSHNGSGDFVSLAIRNRSVEYRFDTGSGYAIMTSKTSVLRKDEWVDVIASREQTMGALLINEEELIRGSARGKNIGLNLGTQLYVGGVDSSRSVISNKVGVYNGFVGCVSMLEVNTRPVDLIHAVVDSEQVVNCDAMRSCADWPCKNGGQCAPTPSPTHRPPAQQQSSAARSMNANQSAGYMCICKPGFMGRNCEVEEGVCEFSHPCQNGGTCLLSENGVDFVCYCPAGWTGSTCVDWVGIPSGMSLAFEGNSLVVIDRDSLPHLVDAEEMISLTMSTRERNGLIYYQGQEVDRNGRGHDYVALSVDEGLVRFLFELGSGTAEIVHPTPVDDGLPHKVMFRRMGNMGALEVDDIHISGQSEGNLVQLNTNGDIFLGGLPNMKLMSGNRFRHFYRGCISNLNMGNSRRVNMINGTADVRVKETRNVRECN